MWLRNEDWQMPISFFVRFQRLLMNLSICQYKFLQLPGNLAFLAGCSNLLYQNDTSMEKKYNACASMKRTILFEFETIISILSACHSLFVISSIKFIGFLLYFNNSDFIRATCNLSLQSISHIKSTKCISNNYISKMR